MNDLKTGDFVIIDSKTWYEYDLNKIVTDKETTT